MVEVDTESPPARSTQAATPSVIPKEKMSRIDEGKKIRRLSVTAASRKIYIRSNDALKDPLYDLSYILCTQYNTITRAIDEYVGREYKNESEVIFPYPN